MIEYFKGDKSTIVSVVPFRIEEFKPGLYPGRFVIPPCLNDAVPQVYLVGPSEHIMHIAEQPVPLRVVTPSYEVAASLVRDYVDGKANCDEGAQPGIAWLHGSFTTPQIIKEQVELLQLLRDQQRNWFVNLVKQIDDDWSRYHTHKVASDEARFAARALGIEPEWMHDEIAGDETKCPACHSNNSKEQAICSTCRCVLDADKYAKLKFA